MEDHPDHSQPESLSPSPSTSTVDEPSSSSSASPFSSGNLNPDDQPQQAENGQPEPENEDSSGHRPQQQRQSSILSYRVNITISGAPSGGITDDVWSCLVVVMTFWAFASMTLILGVFGSITLTLGPNCSRLVQINSFFVQSIQVEAIDESRAGPMLYGFYEPPPLDTAMNWTETHKSNVPVDFHKEWVYFLNNGSKLDIFYSVKSSSSLPLCLVIAQGRESLVEWIEDPSYPNSTLSWNIIYGSGRIQQEILRSSDYYIAVGNLNNEEVEVVIQHQFLYLLGIPVIQLKNSPAGPNYGPFLLSVERMRKLFPWCSISEHFCSLRLLLFGTTTAVLTSPGPEEDALDDHWHVKLSYGPRWIAYIVGSGVMTVIFLLAFRFCSIFQAAIDGRPAGELESERAPLLFRKEDDDSSWGSYDSKSHDEEDVDEWLAANSLERKPIAEGENHRRFCVICFDAARDCFFLPCGHCAACFTCGTRIAEEANTCPICRRSIKKVRKIFTV